MEKFTDLLNFIKENNVEVSLNGDKLQIQMAGDVSRSADVTDAFRQHKPALMAYLKEQREQLEDIDLTSVDRGEELPLSFAQERMLFASSIENDNSHYNISSAWAINGVFDYYALVKAVNHLVSKYEILRTHYIRVNEGFVQKVRAADEIEIFIPQHDLSDLNSKDLETQTLHLVTAASRRNFDLASEIVFRAEVIKQAVQSHILVLVVHHIASDGQSQPILLQDLMAFYAQLTQGVEPNVVPPKLQYVDYARWQRKQLGDREFNGQLDYWLRNLNDLPLVHALPLKQNRPHRRRFEGMTLSRILSKVQLDALREYASEHGATMFMLLQSAFSVLISKWSGTNDIVMGTPVSDRNNAEVLEMVGVFLNTLVLRDHIDPHLTFSQHLARSVAKRQTDLEHRLVPFELLVEKLNPPRSQQHDPLFQIIFSHQYARKPQQNNIVHDLGNVAFVPFRKTQSKFKFELGLNIYEAEESLELIWEYSTELFSQNIIEKMADHLLILLANAIALPEFSIDTISLLTPEDKQLLLDWSGQDLAFALSATPQGLHHAFTEQAVRSPQLEAVWHKGVGLSYEQLNYQSDQLAFALLDKGLKGGQVVGMALPKGIEALISLLAILKSGGVYLPLDVNLPLERLSFMASDAEAKWIIANNTHPYIRADELAFLSWLNVSEVLAQTQNTDQHHMMNRVRTALPEVETAQRAYIIYTSGSTGCPKGVEVSHTNASQHINELKTVYQLEEMQRTLAFSSFSFDASIEQIFLPLSLGKKVYLYDPKEENLWDYLAQNKIDYAHLTPSYLNQVLDEKSNSASEYHLKLLNLGGEAFPTALLSRCIDAGVSERYINSYGPTECVVTSHFHEVDLIKVRAEKTACENLDQSGAERLTTYLGKTLPIGRVLKGRDNYLLSPTGELVPPGAVGELCIGGNLLALGYLGYPELTNLRFVAHPYLAGSRLYKTGDLARFLEDGELEYIGRTDSQVKLRGFRIELEEISSVLNQLTYVVDSIAIVRLNGAVESLVAYVKLDITTANQGRWEQNQIVHKSLCKDVTLMLSEYLPEYMIPNEVIFLREFPLTISGKLDVNALPAPLSHSSKHAEIRLPQTALEKSIAAVWQDVLGVKNLDMNVSFFELGGHSLLAMRLVGRMRKELGVKVSLKELFEDPTLSGLSTFLLNDAQVFETSVMRKADRSQPLALSYDQLRIWLVDQVEADSSHYYMAFAWDVEGHINYDLLLKALNAIEVRHEILRTGYVNEYGDDPYQIVFEQPTSAHAFTDLTKHNASGTLIASLKESMASEPFDLNKGTVLRTHLVKCSGGQYVFMLTVHHIAFDGWSLDLYLNELSQLYLALVQDKAPSLPKLEYQYVDYAVWQRQLLDEKTSAQLMEFWKAHLTDVPKVHSLVTDYPRPETFLPRGGAILQSIDKQLFSDLKQLSIRNNTSMFALLQTAFAVFLSRVGQSTDIVMGTPLANRDHDSLSNMIGIVLNTVVLRTSCEGNPSFSNLLSQNNSILLDSIKYGKLPIEAIIDELGIERHAAHPPLFQIMFTYTKEENKLKPSLDFLGLNMEAQGVVVNRFKYELALRFNESENGLVANWEYSLALFDEASIRGFASQFENMLLHLVRAPKTPIESLSLLPNEESLYLLETLNRGHRAEQRFTTLNQGVSLAAQTFPQRIALVDNDETLTFSQLDMMSSKIASLLRDKGVRPGEVVGVVSIKNVMTIASILAVHKLGAAYLPLDPNYPQSRLDFMVADAGVNKVIMTRVSDADLFVSAPPNQVMPSIICLSSNESKVQLTQYPEFISLDSPTQAESLAYLIYTSGTSGRPKAVAVEHSAVCQHLNALIHRYPLDSVERVMLSASLSFDASINQLFMPLLSGKTCYLFEPLEHDFWEFIDRHQIDFAHVTPSYLYSQLEHSYVKNRSSSTSKPILKVLNLGGEKLEPSLLDLIKTRSLSQILINSYGPTETIVSSHAAIYDLTELSWRPKGIGRAIGPRTNYVLDDKLNLVPKGSIGELYIGGDCLARGYFNLPELTKKAFVPDPYSPNGRLYKTGDRVRWNNDDQLEFIGRVDTQVKFNGFRIELGEIEVALAQHQDVSRSVVVLDQGESGQVSILAYVEQNQTSQIGEGELKVALQSYLVTLLPKYMQPTSLLVVKQFALNRNGKIDKTKLPKPSFVLPQDSRLTTPQTSTELVLLPIWQEVLQRGNISTDSNFFELGGHSLVAMRLIGKMNRALNKRIKLTDLFAKPSIREVSALYNAMVKDADKVVIEHAERGEAQPLSFSQQRMWLIDMLEGQSTHYNVDQVWRVSGVVDILALEKACNDLVRHHSILNTCYFKDEHGAGWQQIKQTKSADLEVMSLKHVPVTEREYQLNALVKKRLDLPFDLSSGDVFRVTVIEVAEGEYTLIISAHHIATDGWSQRILISELVSLYGYYTGHLCDYPSVSAYQYLDYAKWQRDFLKTDIFTQQLDYWKQQLKGIPSTHGVVLDRERPEAMTFNGANLGQYVSSELNLRLNQLAIKNNTTLFALMETAFALLLSRWGGQEDVVIGVPVANRTQAEFESTLGMFANTLVLRTQIDLKTSFTDLLLKNTQVLLSAYQNQYVPFEMLVEELNPVRSLSHNPLFQIAFSINGQNGVDAQTLELPNLSLSPFAYEQVPAKFDLTLHVSDSRQGLYTTWNYNTDLFNSATIQSLMESYIWLLSSIVENSSQAVGRLELIPSPFSLDEEGHGIKPLQQLTPKMIWGEDVNRELAEFTDRDVKIVYQGQSYSIEAFILLNMKLAKVAFICFNLDSCVLAYVAHIDGKPDLLTLNRHDSVVLDVSGIQVPQHCVGKLAFKVPADLKDVAPAFLMTMLDARSCEETAIQMHLVSKDYFCSSAGLFILSELIQDLSHFTAFNDIHLSIEYKNNMLVPRAFIAISDITLESTVNELRAYLDGKTQVHGSWQVYVSEQALRLDCGALDQLFLNALVIQQDAASETISDEVRINVAKAWEQALGAEISSGDEHFFRSGGSSLTAVTYVSLLKVYTGVDMSMRSVFQSPTFIQQCVQVSSLLKKATLSLAPISTDLNRNKAPLTFAQQRIWFIDKIESAKTSYLIPMAWRVEGALNKKALENALRELVERHSALRSIIVGGDDEKGGVYQVLRSSNDFNLYEEDLTSLSLVQQRNAIDSRIVEESKTPIVLEDDFMVRARLLTLKEDSHVLYLTFHHIAMDEWSIGVVKRDFVSLYQAEISKTDSGLENLALSILDYAVLQNNAFAKSQFIAGVKYWQKQLKDINKLHSLPLDFVRPKQQSFDGGNISLDISPEIVHQIHSACESFDVTPFMLLQTSFAVFLTKWGEAQDVVVGTPMTNRDRPELADLVGMLLNMVALRTRVNPNISFSETLQENKQSILSAFEHKQLPFDLLLNQLEVDRDSRHAPIFQITFVYTEDEPVVDALKMPGLTFNPISSDMDFAKYELSLYISSNKKRFVTRWNYNKALFKEETVEQFAFCFNKLLAKLLEQPDKKLKQLPLSGEKETGLDIEQLVGLSIVNFQEAQHLLKQHRSAFFSLNGKPLSQEQWHEQGSLGTGLTFAYVTRNKLFLQRIFGELAPHGDKILIKEEDVQVMDKDGYIAPLYFHGQVVIPDYCPEEERFTGKYYQTRLKAKRLGQGEIEVLSHTSNYLLGFDMFVDFGALNHRLCHSLALFDAFSAYSVDRSQIQVLLITDDIDNKDTLVGRARELISEVCQDRIAYTVHIRHPETVALTSLRKSYGEMESSLLQRYIAEMQLESILISEDVRQGMQDAWSAAINKDVDHDHAHFFELGGNSLTAIVLVSHLNNTFNLEMQITEIFENPTFIQLAHRVELLSAAGGNTILPVTLRPEAAPIPLTYVQERLLRFDLAAKDKSLYLANMAWDIEGELDRNTIQASFGLLVERHVSLRTTVGYGAKGELLQILLPNEDFSIEFIDLSNNNGSLTGVSLENEIAKKLDQPIDLYRDFMLRVSLFKTGAQRHTLLVSIHHMAVDEWSMEIIKREFSQIFAAKISSTKLELPSLALNFHDYSYWQRTVLTQQVLAPHIEYWNDQLAEVSPVHHLPLDNARQAELGSAGAVFSTSITRDLHVPMQNLAFEHECTLFMLLETSYAILLSVWGQEADVLIGSPMTSRAQFELMPVVGLFQNLLPLRTQVNENISFSKMLENNRGVILDAFEHQIVPFELLLKSLDVRSNAAYRPLCQLAFVYNESRRGPDAKEKSSSIPEEKAVSFNTRKVGKNIARYELVLVINNHDGEYTLSWLYNSDLFDAKTIEKIALGYGELLYRLVTMPNTPLKELALTSLIIEQDDVTTIDNEDVQ